VVILLNYIRENIRDFDQKSGPTNYGNFDQSNLGLNFKPRFHWLKF